MQALPRIVLPFCLAGLLFAADPVPAAASPRLVSLAPSLTELVCDIGFSSNLVGRSSACDYPPAVRALPVAGDFGRPTLEALLALKPDVLLVTDVEQAATLAAVREAGVRVLQLPCENWAQLAAAARAIAATMGEPARGEEWSARLTNRVAAIQRSVGSDARRPRIYIEVWGDPLTTAARDSFVAEIIRTAGAANIGDSLSGRYATVNGEWVVASKPDLILLAYMPESATPDRDALAHRVGWRDLAAVRDNRLIRTIPADLLLRPGPRLIEGCERLAAAIRDSARN